jgi:phosphoglycolate phosphatase
MIKNLIFDLDGTIADDMDEFFDIFNKLSKKYGFAKIEKNQIESFKNKGAQWLFNNIKIATWKIPFLISEGRNMLNETIENINPFKGMPEVLKRLKSDGFTLGILTTNTEANVKKFLENNNLDVFDFIYSKSSLFGKHKIITKIVKKHNLDKTETCYIGDEDRDIEAAKKAGVTSAAVTWGFNTKTKLVSTNPDFIIDKPSDILTIVQ